MLVVIRVPKTSQAKLENILSLSDQVLKPWLTHDRLGYCLRLGLAKSSYFKSSSILDRMGITSSLVDYGSLSETNLGSYVEHHKTLGGSLTLWKESERMSILENIVGHTCQLAAQ